MLADGAANLKTATLSRAEPALQKLQEKLATNLFSGLPQYEANRVDGMLRSIRWVASRKGDQAPAVTGQQGEDRYW